MGDVAGGEPVVEDGDSGDEAGDGEEGAEGHEEGQGAVIAQDLGDGDDDAGAVREGVQLGDAAGGAVFVFDGDFQNAHAPVQGVQGDVGFYLEAFDENGVGFDEGAVEDAVAAHDVHEVGAEESVDEVLDESVAEVVQGAFVLAGVVAAGMAVAHDHVGLAFEHGAQQVVHAVGGVGEVGVGQDVSVGLGIEEGAAHGVAFALAGLVDNFAVNGQPGQGVGGDLVGGVLGVVVDDDDAGLGQFGVKRFDGGRDGEFFVIGGQDDRNAGCVRGCHIEQNQAKSRLRSHGFFIGRLLEL